jgi:hypothetical protein
VAATVNVAVWPTVTVWAAGCAVIDGAPWTALVLPETIPEHPEFAIASGIANKTRAQRFIVRLFPEIFSVAAGGFRIGDTQPRVLVLASRSGSDPVGLHKRR